MIKGINKQIIEIKCTNNEYFDKVLLFVNSKNYGISTEYLKKQAKELSDKIIGGYTPKKRKSIRFFQIIGIVSVVLLTVMVWLIISVI